MKRDLQRESRDKVSSFMFGIIKHARKERETTRYRPRRETYVYFSRREGDNFRTHNGVFSRIVTFARARAREHFVHKEHKLELSLPMPNSPKNTPPHNRASLGSLRAGFYGTYNTYNRIVVNTGG